MGASLHVSSDSTACVDSREGGRKTEGTPECDIVLRDLFPIHRVAPGAPQGEQWLTLANLALTPTGFLGRERASQATFSSQFGSTGHHRSPVGRELEAGIQLEVVNLVWLHLTEDLCW